MLRAYLLDDELPALRRLKRLLQATGRVEICGSSMNPESAIECISADRPELLFLDIQMPGMDGFEVLARLTYQPWVIFTTAYDHYALKAFEVNSIDYLVKPIEPKQLERALNKLSQLRDGGTPQRLDPEVLRDLLAELSQTPRGPAKASFERIPIRVGEGTRFLDTLRITHFFTEGRLAFAAADGKSHCVERTITELEQELGVSSFVRIHRGVLLNLDWLDELTPWFTGRMLARLKDEKHTELVVARDRVRILKERLGL